MNSDILSDLYETYTGKQPDKITELTGSGSNRKYFRLHGSPDIIGVIGETTEENLAFIYLSDHFAGKGIHVPRVLATSTDRKAYLQEDLGETHLFDVIANGRYTGRFSNEEISILEKTIRCLPDIQYNGCKGLDFKICYPLAEFNRRSVMWDLNYFKYCFLKTSAIYFNENRLENDFENLADTLLQKPAETFMYRDFQSRNVMIKEGNPWFIDFQGGRKGPVYYDVASFLWQAKANIPSTLRQYLIDCYIDSATRYETIDPDIFKAELRHFVLFRMLQVLGAYGFRGVFERKPHFIESIPPALENLRHLLDETPFDQYPELTDILKKLISKKNTPPEKKDGLTVTVTSFSYKRGIPEDKSGNGGGFVFDCRAMHNPGRYDEYKRLTGLDKPVIDFLEDRGEVQIFLKECRSLADASVKSYLKRGFTDLMINFGCTGGQHRSVYCAEKMASYLNSRYGVEVNLIHREQGLTKTLRHKSDI